MAEERQTRNIESNSTQGFSKTITAIELAELVIEITSAVVPAIDNLNGDEEAKRMIVEALTRLQKKAIEYALSLAKRSTRRNNTWRRERTWRR